MNKDTLVGIVGSVILVAAMVIVFAYERSNAVATDDGAPDDMAATFNNHTVAGSVGVGASDTKMDNFTVDGPTNVTFLLTWSATNGRDTLRLTVMPPPGSEMVEGATSEASDEGTISLRVAVPAGGWASGEWTVKVDFTEANPDSLPGGIDPPVPPPMSTDSSVSYSVAVSSA